MYRQEHELYEIYFNRKLEDEEIKTLKNNKEAIKKMITRIADSKAKRIIKKTQ